MQKTLKNMLYPLLSLGALLLFWYLLALVVGKELLIPSPSATFQQFGALLGTKIFYQTVASTLLRSAISFALAAVVALIFAVFAILLPPFQKFFSPIITVVRAVPTMSVILLSVIWLKPSFSPILVSFLVVFPMLYNGFYNSFLAIDTKLVEMSRLYRVPLSAQIFKFYLPSVAPSFFSNLGAGASFNVKIIISAEVLASTAQSIGNMMQLDKIYFETASLLAWTLVAVLLSYAYEGFFYCLKKIFVRWEA